MTASSTASVEVIPGEWHVRYNYPAGATATHFFEGLRRKQILASRCSKSGLSYLPPRAYCERSFEACDEWVEAGMTGTIEAATIVSAAFENLPEPPYAIAYVRLDGVDTAMINFVRGLDLSDVPAAAQRLLPGQRVRVVFKAQPEGRITDFHYELA
ncbi:MAG: Zn-ribbon domain-containing OB-fold protein [Burkholderiales bacterium]|nr:MAG: Zn-ribbon domain-containing OB-fold protein [Burkholderiales bacterium]